VQVKEIQIYPVSGIRAKLSNPLGAVQAARQITIVWGYLSNLFPMA
jgi:hypothetical protein